MYGFCDIMSLLKMNLAKLICSGSTVEDLNKLCIESVNLVQSQNC